jgi:hypothetical protein
MLGFIDKYPNLQETPAQFQERCGQIALACFWKEQRGEQTVPTVRCPTNRIPSDASRKAVRDFLRTGWLMLN